MKKQNHYRKLPEPDEFKVLYTRELLNVLDVNMEKPRNRENPSRPRNIQRDQK
ncbi:MAG: hypothetical protein ACO25B_10465 [Chitinophagaceae bacterium]